MKTENPNPSDPMNWVENKRSEFELIRSKYDPFYEFTDDHKVYMTQFSYRRQLSYLRADLGLWGQDLEIPVCNFHGQMEYV